MARTSDRTRLVALSALMLFAELGLIRWSGAYSVYLSFFTNFILLASFLGVGVGFLRAGRRPALFRYAGLAVAAWVGFVIAFPVVGGRVRGQLQVIGGFGLPALPQWLSLAVSFVLAFAVMATLAHGVAETFVRFAPLDAYRLDILGSIAGIVAFSVLAFVQAPPIVWGVAVAAALLWLGRRSLMTVVPIAIFVAGLVALSVTPRTFWSPYQRIGLSATHADGSIDVEVNGRPHQRIMSMAVLESGQRFRFTPYERSTRPPGNVLVIGAGTGNDVAIALRQGAEHVDAVEIDPVLAGLGEELHPERPYDDGRVDVHVQDARAFLHDADATYDLVLFAIPDSLTAFAGQSALRLENFLFTEEALAEVRAHLSPDGVVAMYHYYLPSVIDRYAATLADAMGVPPCVDVSPGAGPRPRVVLTSSPASGSLDCETVWERPAQVPEADTDDYPFPYLVTRGIPRHYLVALAAILLGSVVAVRLSVGNLSGTRRYLDLFFMGAAFLLLETTNVVRFALLFGTTWFVNALVFAGILASVLVAIEISRRHRFRRIGWWFGALFASLVVAWAVEPSSLLSLGLVPRFLAAVALGFTPVMLGNVIFADRFRDVGSSAVAFGTNLLGAIAGGLLEYAALITGYRALLIVAAVLYGAAFVAGRAHLVELRERRREPAPAAVGV
jgi:hypothetical protein